jgi:threonyl-tRNA synthetase
MYTPMELDDAEYRLKPMNCPGHILIYKNSPKSYRDLPQRYAELGNVYRYERSGTMHGLLARPRLYAGRCPHLLHAFEQIEDEVVACIDFAEACSRPSASMNSRSSSPPGTPDRAHYTGSTKIGTSPKARSTRCSIAKASLQNHPRRSRLLRPQDRHQARRRPRPPLAALHRAIRLQPPRPFRARIRRRRRRASPARHGPPRALRLVERFFGVLIEHYAGAFPLWLAPCRSASSPSAKASRLRPKSRSRTQSRRPARRSRRPQRKDERQNPRLRQPETPTSSSSATRKKPPTPSASAPAAKATRAPCP